MLCEKWAKCICENYRFMSACAIRGGWHGPKLFDELKFSAFKGKKSTALSNPLMDKMDIFGSIIMWCLAWYSVCTGVRFVTNFANSTSYSWQKSSENEGLWAYHWHVLNPHHPLPPPPLPDKCSFIALFLSSLYWQIVLTHLIYPDRRNIFGKTSRRHYLEIDYLSME